MAFGGQPQFWRHLGDVVRDEEPVAGFEWVAALLRRRRNGH